MKNKLFLSTLVLPAFALADISDLQQKVTQGLTGLEAAIWAVGAIAIAVTVAFVAIKLLKRSGKVVG